MSGRTQLEGPAPARVLRALQQPARSTHSARLPLCEREAAMGVRLVVARGKAERRAPSRGNERALFCLLQALRAGLLVGFDAPTLASLADTCRAARGGAPLGVTRCSWGASSSPRTTTQRCGHLLMPRSRPPRRCPPPLGGRRACRRVPRGARPRARGAHEARGARGAEARRATLVLLAAKSPVVHLARS